jgi:phage-related protein
VTLGSIRSNIADTIANQQQEIQQAPTKSDLQKAKDAATAWLTNGKGYAYFRKDDLGNIVDILFMDTKDPSTAVNVMRVGQSGIGFSHNGVNGQYESAWTIDGNFVADWIKSGTLDANLINVINLIAENVLSTSGESSISVSGAELDMFYGDKRTVVINNAYGNAAQLAFTVYDDNGNLVQAGNYNAHQFEIGGAGASSRLMLSVNESGEASLYLPTDGKTRKISWQDNGDGTYTLIGS